MFIHRRTRRATKRRRLLTYTPTFWKSRHIESPPAKHPSFSLPPEIAAQERGNHKKYVFKRTYHHFLRGRQRYRRRIETRLAFLQLSFLFSLPFCLLQALSRLEVAVAVAILQVSKQQSSQ